jgi:CRP-like cAMP-binding protein
MVKSGHLKVLLATPNEEESKITTMKPHRNSWNRFGEVAILGPGDIVDEAIQAESGPWKNEYVNQGVKVITYTAEALVYELPREIFMRNTTLDTDNLLNMRRGMRSDMSEELTDIKVEDRCDSPFSLFFLFLF